MNDNEITLTVTEEQARAIISALERDGEKGLAEVLQGDVNQQLYNNDEPDQFRHDGEADADALASAGFGAAEDYGDYGDNENHHGDE